MVCYIQINCVRRRRRILIVSFLPKSLSRVLIVMPCDFSVWAPFWTDYVAHRASISCVVVFLAAVSWNLLPLGSRGGKIAAIFAFRSFPQGKWSFVDLFEFPLANMVKATYENIRKLCSGVFSRKQTVQFAPNTTASCWCVNSVAFLRRFNFSLRSYLWDSTLIFPSASERWRDECKLFQVAELWSSKVRVLQ